MMPNFLIIGAAKSGTISLYRYLEQHPQVYLSPVKETEFFAFEGNAVEFLGPGFNLRTPAITDLEDYVALFEGVGNEIALGEASPVYLYSPKAVGRIAHYIPYAKMIAILRNPVDRAYSQFVHNIRDGIEPLDDFDKAIGAENGRVRDRWFWGYHYVRAGFYFDQLERYFSRFSRSQVRIYLFEDFVRDPLTLVHDLFRYLEVDDVFRPDLSVKYNVSGFPRSPLLHRLLTKPSRTKNMLKAALPEEMCRQVKHVIRNRNLAKRQISQETRVRLIETYRNDVSKLEALIQRDLSAWLQ